MAALTVEVVYALPGEADLVTLSLPSGATARDALAASGLAQRHPEIDPGRARLGIFGRRVSGDARLADGDRVEVYRPLLNDPKEARQRRARRRR